MATSIACPPDREEVVIRFGANRDGTCADGRALVRPGETAWGWTYEELRRQGGGLMEFVLPGEEPERRPAVYEAGQGPLLIRVTLAEVIERLKRFGLPCRERGTLRRIRDMLDAYPDIRRHLNPADLAWLEMSQ